MHLFLNPPPWDLGYIYSYNMYICCKEATILVIRDICFLENCAAIIVLLQSFLITSSSAIYTIGYKGSSRIKSFQQFLVRSCQNELMRSNNFVVKVAGKKCSEVAAQATNYENKASV